MSEAEALRFELKIKLYARAVSLLAIALATALFLLRILSHRWAAYTAVQRFPAALLCGGVILNPIGEIWLKNGAARDSVRFRAVLSWSALLMIAVVLWSEN